MKSILLLLVLVISSFSRVQAQDNMMVSQFFSDFISDMKEAEEKVESLAEAVPQDKYTWHPAEGVRSISEVYMHIVGGNYFLLTTVGGKMPEGLTRDMEKTVTDKAEIMKWLKDSYKAVTDFVSTMKDEELDQKQDFFGNQFTKRQILFVLMNHTHEHLGQSIAYARMNKIVPPWSMPAAEN